MAYEYLNNKPASNIVGGFNVDPNKDFTENLRTLTESFQSNYGCDIWAANDFTALVKNKNMRAEYKEGLIGQCLESNINDPWFGLHAAKMEQLFENSVEDIITESAAGSMSPVVAYTLPILKKNYYECISKEIMMTEVPDKPFVRMVFERPFLKDADGNKFYIPEVFYSNEYKTIMNKSKGIDIGEATAGSSLTLPLTNFDILGACGVSLKTRDQIDYDFGIYGIKLKRPDATYRMPLKPNPEFDPTIPETNLAGLNPRYMVDVASPMFVEGLNDKDTLTDSVAITIPLNPPVQPNYAEQGVLISTIKYEGFPQTTPFVKAVQADGVTEYDGVLYSGFQPKVFETKLYGNVDQYQGTVSVMVADSRIEEVVLGGHLSNQNNDRTVEIDYERQAFEWKIEEQERINTGMTVEKIKDYRALLDVDITAKTIADMTTVLTQSEDSNTLDFVDQEYNTWKSKRDLPFGYAGHVSKQSFIEEAQFSCIPQTGVLHLQSDWIDSQLKFNIDQLIARLNTKLNNKDLMYVIYGHPTNVMLLRNHVKWVVNNDTKVGGVQLEYNFGVLANVGSGTRVHVVSSQKVPESTGLRIVAYPTSQDIITMKHFKYSFNIENGYRNPLTQNIPNIMACQRYTSKSLTPVMGTMHLINNGFGNLNPVGIKTGVVGYQS